MISVQPSKVKEEYWVDAANPNPPLRSPTRSQRIIGPMYFALTLTIIRVCEEAVVQNPPLPTLTFQNQYRLSKLLIPRRTSEPEGDSPRGENRILLTT